MRINSRTYSLIVRGGSRKLRDAVARGQFALGFSGRGENIRDLPKGTPVKFIVPREGQAWTPFSLATIKGAARPNAAKVIMTWFYELENLQAWNTHAGRNVPHPKVKPPIPEMGLTAYPLMKKIPSEQLGDPNFFSRRWRGYLASGDEWSVSLITLLMSQHTWVLQATRLQPASHA